MRSALTGVLMFACGAAGSAAHVEAANLAAGHPIDVCRAQSIPKATVGKLISIHGRIQSDVESSWIYGDACPNIVVRLRYRASGPSLISRLTDSGDSRCGGLSRNGQLAIVEGFLTGKRDMPASSRGLPVEAGTIEVTSLGLNERTITL
jgi:hypothetical protein